LAQDIPVRTITAIDSKFLDHIQDWLNSESITYTYGKASMTWPALITTVKGEIEDGVFYLDVDPVSGERKDPGWLFLGVEDPAGEEEDEDESSYSEESEESEESESESEDESSDYDDESDDGSDYDDGDDLSEEGKVSCNFIVSFLYTYTLFLILISI